jgi:uncharacterized protein (DUF2267 family)
MSTTTTPDVFESTMQQTNEWLGAIAEQLGWDDRQLAYIGLRGPLHALRDYLVVDESAQLAAQLPLLVRGVYYEGWDPSKVPVDNRSRDDFLRRVAGAFERADPGIDAEQVSRAVLGLLSDRISQGETDQARRLLPKDVQSLWT